MRVCKRFVVDEKEKFDKIFAFVRFFAKCHVLTFGCVYISL